MNRTAVGDFDRDCEFPITVFTPTYNRAARLKRAYESLRDQTYGDFEWLIVDDSSTDGTADLVEQWQAESEFPIRFRVQEHSGKHHAYNIAIEASRGRFFVGLDSDDELFPNALERLLALWDEIPDDRENISGVSCLNVTEDGDVYGDKFPEDRMFANYFELRYKHGVEGAGVGCNRTAILRDYPFPTLDDVRYIPESTVWSEIGKQYTQYCVNEPLGIYHSETDDEADALTKRGNTDDSKSFVLWHRKRLNEHLPWFRYDPLTFFVSAVGYVRHSLHAGEGPLTQVTRLELLLARLLWAVALPIGSLVYVTDELVKQ
ncbi:glycosyltransferase family 2 protein [Halobacteriales archaeon QS_1_68_17]|nr:MAG: glycosyltransferase family 2 protein [Halobacteriales archaeon QS_1_68_17]